MIDSVSLSGALRATGPDLSAPIRASATGGSDFGQVLAQVVGSAADNLRAGEAAAIGGIRGATPLHDVVDAVMNAERSLQTALALRDKTVAAWQEISRMSI